MPKVRNASDYDLELRPADGPAQIVEKGHHLEVSAALRDELVKQDNWDEVKSSSTKDDDEGDE